ncbi:SusC/RagA family TonB-linked outer membrane protein [Lewinella sp. IMCC34183]|uniref:SusC/RagA family TonB-linked outer membrane protein n=1 Tax=Lewinella sp. IMCC34183 TaxID=2248762 RepID=UPI000E22DBFA|nr:TonB-dependent receptor [Lewinella sp. IMCC34183]
MTPTLFSPPRRWWTPLPPCAPLLLVLFGLCFTLSPTLSGQDTPGTAVSGTVIDADGLGLPGVTVLETGTTNGTQTDLDGNYLLNVASPSATLRFTFIGMEPVERTLDGRTTLDVTMTENVSTLDEVVVVGYGTQSRSRVVSAVDQISEDAFDGRPAVNATQALQGKSASLVIQQRNSEPGAGVNINIRGVSTLGNNSPLIVIDGIVGGDINSLNPADIASVSILKDAGSAAIYGSRASNGVVLITTKKGRNNRALTVQYNGLAGINRPQFFTEPVSALENAVLRNEAAFNSNQSAAVYSPQQLRDIAARGSQQWFAEEIVQDALQQNHNLSVSGGNENSTYLVSAGYLDQESNYVGPDRGVQRYNLRVNLSTSTDRFNLTSTLAYAKQRIRDHSFNTATLMVDAFRVPLYYDQKDSSGRYLTNDVLQQFNPLGILEEGGFRQYDNDDLFGTLSGEFEVLPGWKVRGVFGGRLYINSQFARTLRVDFFPKGVYGEDRNTNDEFRRNLDLNTQLISEYARSFGGGHDLNLLVGISNENHQDRGIGIFKRYTDPDLGTPITDTEIAENSYNSNQSSSRNSLNSIFGRLSYSFADKYFTEFSFRYDGSSKFTEYLRWGLFPSVSVGYNLTNEPFMANYLERFGNVKLRASYGVLGNQNVGNYQYQTTYFTFQNAYAFNNSGVSGAGYNFANPNLQWERAATLNLGADLSFFQGALSVSADYFDKITSDILVPPAVPGVYGTGLPDFNAGKVQSRGWEVSTTYRHYGDLFSHTLQFNLGDTRNTVLDFQGNERLTGVEELQTILREGLPFNSYVGLKRDGYFQNMQEIEGAAVPEGLTPVPGDNRYVDLNEDGVINDQDKFVFGNPFPRLTFGLTYGMNVKGFDLSVFVQGVGKRTMMIRGEQVEPFHFNYGATMYTHQLDYWTPFNTDARYPRLANNGTQSITNNYRRGSDMYLFNGAYARLKNVQVGYTLPQRLTEVIGLQQFRVYLSGQNLATLSKVGFVDPELSEFDNNLRSGGANSGRAYPTLVYYGVGVDATF